MNDQLSSVTTQDRTLDDFIRESPVDLEQDAIHRKLLHVATPWLWFVAPTWVLAATARRVLQRFKTGSHLTN